MTKAEKIADDVARLAGTGMSRNRIAEQLGVAAGTVTKAARLRGVEFDRAQTIAATEAVVHDARASRASLASRMVAAAHAGLDAFHQALAAGNSTDARNWMTAAAIASDKHLALDLHGRTDTKSLAAVDAWTTEMLGRAHDEKLDPMAMSEDDLDALLAAHLGPTPHAIEGTR